MSRLTVNTERGGTCRTKVPANWPDAKKIDYAHRIFGRLGVITVGWTR